MKKKRSSFSLSTIIGAVVFGVLVLGVIAANMGSQQSQDLRNQAAGPSLKQQMEAGKGGETEGMAGTGTEAGSTTGTLGLGGEGGLTPGEDDCRYPICDSQCELIQTGITVVCGTSCQNGATCTTREMSFFCPGRHEAGCNEAIPGYRRENTGSISVGAYRDNPSNWCTTIQVDAAAYSSSGIGGAQEADFALIFVGDNGQYCIRWSNGSQTCDPSTLDWDCTRPSPSPSSSPSPSPIAKAWHVTSEFYCPGQAAVPSGISRRLVYRTTPPQSNTTSGWITGAASTSNVSATITVQQPSANQYVYVGLAPGNAGTNWLGLTYAPSDQLYAGMTRALTYIPGRSDTWLVRWNQASMPANTAANTYRLRFALPAELCSPPVSPSPSSSPRMTPSPSPSPSPVAMGPMCMSIARQVQSGPNDPDPNTPDVGDYVTFYCGSTATQRDTVTYEFRWQLPNGQVVPLTTMENVGNQTWPNYVEDAGQYHAQCRVCVVSLRGEPLCQPWEPLPDELVKGAYTGDPMMFDEQAGDPAEFDSINDYTQQ